MGLADYEGGQRQFLADGRPAGALEFVVQFCQTADDAAKQRLAPATATFYGVTLCAENVGVLAQFLGGLLRRLAPWR